MKKLLTCSVKQYIMYRVTRKEAIDVTVKSRADYFKERRKSTKAFNVEIDKGKMEAFEEKLSKKNITKKKWLDEKIDDELKEEE